MIRLFNLSAFNSVRGRLLALMAFIVIPLAALSIVLASANYQAAVKAIELSQIQTLSNFTVRSRIWFRGSFRTLVAAVQGVQADPENLARCATILSASLAALPGFKAIGILRPGNLDCFASSVPDIRADQLNALAAHQRTMPFLEQGTGVSPALRRYDAVRIGSELYLVIFAKGMDPGGSNWEAILLANPALLDQAFEVGSLEGTTAIALVNRGRQVIVSRNVDERELGWLPREERLASQISSWEDSSGDGTRHVFASQIVSGPDLYVLARSDKTALNAARIQLLILGLVPLLTLALLFAAYARVIQSNVVGWIAGIERAAQSRRLDPEGTVLAPLDPAMPNDIRSVAEAFNGMVEVARKREFELRRLVASNQFLMRELHHRVKNSLQVIQSYLSLSRRQQRGTASVHLAETEAKVQVLSAAYRLGLTDGGMRLVPVREFAEELISTLSSSMCRPEQRIQTDFSGTSALIVDRIIPLGLALVEAVGAALAEDATASVSVCIHPSLNNGVRFEVATSGRLPSNLSSGRIMSGLAAQLGATQNDRVRGEILNWTFRT